MVKIRIDNIIRRVTLTDSLNVIGQDITGRECIVAKHSFTKSLLDSVLKGDKIRTGGHTYSKV